MSARLFLARPGEGNKIVMQKSHQMNLIWLLHKGTWYRESEGTWCDSIITPCRWLMVKLLVKITSLCDWISGFRVFIVTCVITRRVHLGHLSVQLVYKEYSIYCVRFFIFQGRSTYTHNFDSVALYNKRLCQFIMKHIKRKSKRFHA